MWKRTSNHTSKVLIFSQEAHFVFVNSLPLFSMVPDLFADVCQLGTSESQGMFEQRTGTFDNACSIESVRFSIVAYNALVSPARQASL